MAKKKKKKHHRRQQATLQRQLRQQGTTWLSKQLELINRIYPIVAEAGQRAAGKTGGREVIKSRIMAGFTAGVDRKSQESLSV